MATESFFSNASLAYLASAGAGKDGKTYSIKPTDGTGDFTFSRGSNLAATRVGADGLIEKGRENLLLQSNQFDTTWATLNASVTSGQSGYDGSSDAYLLDASVANGAVYQNVNQNNILTASIYAKKGTANGIRLRMNHSPDTNVYVDLRDGSLSSSANSVDINIQDAGNGWYRISVAFYAISMISIVIYPADGNTTSTAGTIYIQDAQLELGLAATDVIESGATTGKAGLLEDEPRFDYSGGATCPSLLLEPSRTQLFEQSEYFGGWAANPVGISSIEPNYAVSPEGLQNAYKVNFIVQSDSDLALSQTHSITGGSTYAYSIYIKGEGSNIGKDVVIKSKRSGGGDSAGTTTIQTLTNEWKRIDFATTYAANNPQGRLLISSNDATSCLVYGAQAELGSYPTSYIPNHSGGSVTRGAEGQAYSGFSSLMGQTEGTLFLEIDSAENGTEIFSLNRSIANAIFLDTNNSVYRVFIWADGTSFSQVTTIANTDRIKLAIAYQSNNFAIYANGSQVATNNSLTWTPNILIDALNFNVGGYVTSKGVARYNQVLLFKERLSNADLETLTT